MLASSHLEPDLQPVIVERKQEFATKHPDRACIFEGAAVILPDGVELFIAEGAGDHLRRGRRNAMRPDAGFLERRNGASLAAGMRAHHDFSVVEGKLPTGILRRR